MEKIITVAVDGPAGSGKSSVCRGEVAVARKLRYIDSGALYRSVTWFCLRDRDCLDGNIDFETELRSLELEQVFNDNGSCSSFVNGEDVSELIRNEVIARNIGFVSDNVEIRLFVNELLRKWAGSESVIMDGRDIGTVVFSRCHCKNLS